MSRWHHGPKTSKTRVGFPAGEGGCRWRVACFFTLLPSPPLTCLPPTRASQSWHSTHGCCWLADNGLSGRCSAATVVEAGEVGWHRAQICERQEESHNEGAERMVRAGNRSPRTAEGGIRARGTGGRHRARDRTGRKGWALTPVACGQIKKAMRVPTFVPAEVMRMSGAGAPRPTSLVTCSEACRWGSREKHTTQGPTACVIGAATASEAAAAAAAAAGVIPCPTANEATSEAPAWSGGGASRAVMVKGRRSDDARGRRQASSSLDSRLSCGSVRDTRCCTPSRCSWIGNNSSKYKLGGGSK